jgi:hypothetical protein
MDLQHTEYDSRDDAIDNDNPMIRWIQIEI